jgi:predicted O-linked N-acetylglucosamine transferase (SPINDLY family)
MTPITIAQAIQLALGHHRAGRLAEAEAIYRQVLTQAPDHGDALQLLGVLAGQAGRLDVAIELLGRVIAREPAVAAHHSNLGEFYRRAGQWDRAIASFRRALELQPGLARTHEHLASALLAQGRRDEAVAAYLDAIARNPDDAELHAKLGLTLQKMGRLEKAIAAYRRAIALDGSVAVVHNNLGIALEEQRRFDEAIAALGRAIELDPRYAEAHANLGVALHQAGRLDEAIAACNHAIALQPDLPSAQNNLGNALREACRIEEAVAAYRRAVAIKSDEIVAYNNLLFTMHFSPDHDAQAILAENRLWAARFAEPLAAQIRPHANERSPDRRLRIGFVSPDFRDHPAGKLVLPLFRHHDRREAAFVAYSHVRASDRFTQEFQSLADEWHDIVGLSDSEVADRIRGDRIDILVDLALHTAANRLLVFAQKPAPVQVSMLGMPTTTGLATIDYRLTDRYFDPPGPADRDYTERSIRLPRSVWCYEPSAEAPAVGALPAATTGFITFGCLNQLAKVSRPAIQAWIEILQSLPEARLVLQSPPGSHLGPLRRLFQEGAIAPDRVEFVAKVPRREYLRRYLDLDLSLDPFPYNGHTSTFDALWMGVPVIALAGRTGVGRAGVSILSNLGMPELIAATPEQYVATAVGLARDRVRLAGLRSELRQRMQASPLMDGQQYAADVGAAFRRMWREWCGESGRPGARVLTANDAAAQCNRGVALEETGRIDEAIAAYRRAIELKPSLAAAHYNLGSALRRKGRFDEAITAFGCAIELEPGHGAAHSNLGGTLQQAGRLDEAIAAYRQAIAIEPTSVGAHSNLGSAWADLGRFDDAVAALGRALQLDPSNGAACCNLGVALQAIGRLDEAIAAYGRALELAPDSAKTYSNLANALKDVGRGDEAIAALGCAIRLQPDLAVAHNNLGNLLKDQGRLDEAFASFQRALDQQPDYAPAASNLLFTAHFDPDRDARMLLAEHRSWAARFAAPLAAQIQPHRNDRNPDRKLRVGFVSPDFSAHPVGRLLRPLFAHRDRREAEFLAYSDVRAPDAVTRELAAVADGWLTIAGMSDSQVADRIRVDQIDILVDLALHTAGNRMLVLARKPAPVQVTMLGLPSTSGLTTIDYRITDPYLDPPGSYDADYTERSIRLPHCFWCYQPEPDAPPVADLPAWKNGFVTYGCLNQFAKVSRPTLTAFIDILRCVSGSRLILHAQAGGYLERVRATFREAGIADDRVDFAPRVAFSHYLERYRALDLCLDPFPYCGGTTTMDALWMGVPVITLAGRTAVGRGGASILSNLGLTELIARTPEQYVAMAVAWGTDPQRLSQLRAGLRPRMLGSPLMNGKLYATHVEAAFRQMWRTWCGS